MYVNCECNGENGKLNIAGQRMLWVSVWFECNWYDGGVCVYEHMSLRVCPLLAGNIKAADIFALHLLYCGIVPHNRYISDDVMRSF